MSVASPKFRYKAARGDGTIVRGLIDAASKQGAKDELTTRGLYPLSVSPAPSWGWKRPVSRRDLAVLFRTVASLTRSGMPVEKALAASEPLVGGRLREAVGVMRRRVREGAAVSDAMAVQPDVFPRVAVGIVRSGERGSRLAESIHSIAEQLEEEDQLRSQVQSALAYPALILIVGVVSVMVMGLVVVPRFAEVLSDLGAELPRTTRWLLMASSGLRRFGLLGVLGFAGAWTAWSVWSKRPEVRVRIDAALLRIPIIGSIRLGFASARTCRALGAMLSSGMPLLSALDAAADAVGDAEVSLRLKRTRAAVARGQRLTRSLRDEQALTPLALQLVGVGETSGELGEMASRAGEVAGERAQRTLKSMVSLMEPALVVALGLMVALIAAALLQAVYSVRPGA